MIAKALSLLLVICFLFTGCALNTVGNTDPGVPNEPDITISSIDEDVVDEDDVKIEIDDESVVETNPLTPPPTQLPEIPEEPEPAEPAEPAELVKIVTPLDELMDEDMVRIIDYIPDAIVDLKYATEDNFTGQQIYDSNTEAMIRVGTMKKLVQVQEKLLSKGYTLVIWDAYRPLSAQFKLWEVCPNPVYVANPNNGGSSHNCGNTVDITIATLDGIYLEMPTGFDEFSKLADRDYADVSEIAGQNAMFLEEIMKECGFKPYSGEWWHFSDTQKYSVYDG